jgi:uncharacterized protein (TIGR02266 family)
MAENTRKDPRAKVLSMTVRYKSATLDEFIEHHSHDVSRGGMYIKTPQPFPPGTLLKFEVKIAADQKVMQGVGRVVWRREADDASADHPAGMGVKFIKLDNESKDIIDQLVTARMGDISAFDEVEPESEAAMSAGTFEPAPYKVAKDSGAEGFFPKSIDDVPQLAPEDRTVMKQATELLQEALREVGSATTGSKPPEKSGVEDEIIPKAPRVASVTPSPSRAQRMGAPPTAEQTPRVQKTPAPATAEPKPDVKTNIGAKQVAKVAASPISRTPPPAQVKTSPAPATTEAGSAKAANANKDLGSFQPVKPESAPVKKPGSEAAPMTVPASPMATRRVAQAAPPPKTSGSSEEYKIPMRQSVPAGRGARIGIIVGVVGVAAAAVFAMSRKPDAVPPPPTPAPSVSQKIESAPVVLNLTGDKSLDAGPGPSAAASVEAAPAAASASAAPAASVTEKPTVAETPPKAGTAPRIRQVVPRRRKADAGAAAAPPSESPDDLYPTTPTPPKSGSDTSGSTESATPSPNTKSKGKTAPTSAPTTEESPL